VPGDTAPTFPPGLTEDGQAECLRLRAEHLRRFDQDLARELTRLWLSLDLDGPETHPWFQVRQADEARREAGRRKIIDETRQEVRAEVAQELQRAEVELRRVTAERVDLQRTVIELERVTGSRHPVAEPDSRRRDTRRWRIGSMLITVGATATTVMVIPGDNLWLKVAVFAVSVTGALIARPRE
jgi:hypothetical protein